MEVTYLLSNIKHVARQLLENTKSKTILFYGEMGSGKTTLIKAILEELGAEDIGSSPTYSLVNIYETPNGAVNHFDFYRINDETEAWDMGLDEYLDSETWNFIEWPEKIKTFIEPNFQRVELTVNKNLFRKLNIC